MPSDPPPPARRSAVQRLDRLARGLTVTVGRLMGLVILGIIAVILFDVATRGSFYIGSTALQELEWHLHTAVLMLCLGYAYLTDSHVRIGLLRDRWSPRRKALVEFVGCLVFLVPFCAVAIFYGIEFAATAFAQGERSPSPGGLEARWIVKATVPLGMALLLLAGLAVMGRSLAVLLGAVEDDTLFPDRPPETADG